MSYSAPRDRAARSPYAPGSEGRRYSPLQEHSPAYPQVIGAFSTPTPRSGGELYLTSASVGSSSRALVVPSTPMTQEAVEAIRHHIKTEHIIRLEVQRRSIKDAIRIHDEILEDVDDRLAYIEAFKREWLQAMRAKELERQELSSRENYSRNIIAEQWFVEMDEILSSNAMLFAAIRASNRRHAAGGGAAAVFGRR